MANRFFFSLWRRLESLCYLPCHIITREVSILKSLVSLMERMQSTYMNSRMFCWHDDEILNSTYTGHTERTVQPRHGLTFPFSKSEEIPAMYLKPSRPFTFSTHGSQRQAQEEKSSRTSSQAQGSYVCSLSLALSLFFFLSIPRIKYSLPPFDIYFSLKGTSSVGRVLYNIWRK